MEAFMAWFQSNGGSIDLSAMGISETATTGRGAVALRDIPPGHTLFILPRTLTLSTRTSPLPNLFGLQLWQRHGLHKGWVGLILCMMWEDAWTHESGQKEIVDGISGGKWAPYMRTLPAEFDTPMFWTDEEMDELRGTAVVDKIGREDAEKAYWEKLVPAIKTSSTLFPPSHHGQWYSLDAYHRAGSRILSRSFTVSRWEGGGSDNEGSECGGEVEVEDGEGKRDIEASTSLGIAMDVENAVTLDNGANRGLDSDSDSDDDGEDPSDVAMVPMADLLNARWGSENAKLFYEPLLLRMVTTRDIKKNEEIFNTYGDPPNSDLLRRYGHVDFLDLPPGINAVANRGCDIKTLGNPSDIVEIKADLVVLVVRARWHAKMDDGIDERIEWWLDEGGDEGVNPAETLPPVLISLLRLLLLSSSEFEMVREKGKLPKGKLRIALLEILAEVLKRRAEEYKGGSVEDDERLLSNDAASTLPEAERLSANKRHAIIVRLGEKRILRIVQGAVHALLDRMDEDTLEKPIGKVKDKAKRIVSRDGSGADVGRSLKKARR
ncbi:SET domain-containing protein [Phlebopus sp. FC_14]|nr:SET domain-containing protein [Phlebopus sp. FC_14]